MVKKMPLFSVGIKMYNIPIYSPFPSVVYLYNHIDGPTVVHVNIFVRSISKIDDVTMVSGLNYIRHAP